MSQVIKLYGIVNSIGKNTILLGGHNDSIEKLQKLNYKGKNPLTNDGKFYVLFKEEIAIPENITEQKAIVWVHPKKYRFYSKYEENKGELVEGWKLHLVKIEQNNDWS